MGVGFYVLLEDPAVLGSRTSEVTRVVARAFGQPVADVSPAAVEEGRRPRPMADFEPTPDAVRRLTAEIDYWEDRERTKRIDLCLDLIADDPVVVGRIVADEADYSALAGKKQGTLENF